MEELSKPSLSSLQSFLKKAGILEYYQMRKSSGTEDKMVTGRNSNIVKLDLSNLTISSLPPSIGDFEHLEELYLDSCKLTELPDDLVNLSKLRVLSVKNNNLESLPQRFRYVKSIEILNLSNCGDIDKLSGNYFVHFDKLEKLYMGQIGLDSITSKFICPPNLRELDLSQNGLKTFDFESKSIDNLLSLDLSQNLLDELPLEVSMMSSLQQLDLSNNEISEITHEITNLEYLQFLDLSHNKMTEFNIPLCYLTELKVLNVESNDIDHIPPDISNLSSLRELWLADNNITTLPEEIGEMTNLTLLRLNHNCLKTLPKNLLNLDLKELNLLQNNLPNPFNFLCPDEETVIEYYEKICKKVRDNGEEQILLDPELREISKLHVFLDSGQAFLTYNGLTDTINEMDAPLAGVFQVAMNIIDTEGKSFIPIKTKDDRTIQITVTENGIGIGLDLLGLHNSLDLHNDYYLRTAIDRFTEKYGDELRDGIVELDNRDIRHSFILYFG